MQESRTVSTDIQENTEHVLLVKNKCGGNGSMKENLAVPLEHAYSLVLNSKANITF